MESLRINIAGREYPLNVEPSESNQIQSAATRVTEQVEAFRKQYAIEDRIDLLAITALQFASENNADAPSNSAVNSGLNERQNRRVTDLIARLENALDA